MNETDLFLWDWPTYLYLLVTIITVFFLAKYSTYKIELFNNGVQTRKYKVRLLPMGLSFIIVVLFTGLQQNGIDLPVYRILYDSHIMKPFSITEVEFGFSLIYYIAKMIFDDFQGVVILSSLITYIFIYKSALQYKDKIPFEFSILIFLSFYFLIGFTLLRQMVAISIFLYSIKYIAEKKVFKYSLFIFLASIFHISALLLYPVYFIYVNKNKMIYKFFMLIIMILIILVLLISMEETFSYFVLNILKTERYLNYLKLENWGIGNLLVRLPILLLVLISWKSIKKSDPIIIIASEIIIFDVLISQFYYFLPILNRISYYTNISYIFLIPFFVNIYLPFNKKLKTFIIIIASLIIFTFILYNTEWIRNPLMPLKF